MGIKIIAENLEEKGALIDFNSGLCMLLYSIGGPDYINLLNTLDKKPQPLSLQKIFLRLYYSELMQDSSRFKDCRFKAADFGDAEPNSCLKSREVCQRRR